MRGEPNGLIIKNHIIENGVILKESDMTLVSQKVIFLRWLELLLIKN